MRVVTGDAASALTQQATTHDDTRIALPPAVLVVPVTPLSVAIESTEALDPREDLGVRPVRRHHLRAFEVVEHPATKHEHDGHERRAPPGVRVGDA
jgi:hypothetical protein